MAATAGAGGLRSRLAVLAGGNFAIGTGALVIAGVLPAVATDVGVGLGAAGQLLTAYALTYALAAPLLASALAAQPRRRVLIVALLVFGAGNLVAALAPGYLVLMLGRVVSAIGGAAFTPTSSVAAARLAPEADRGRALALVFSGLPIATVLGVPMGTYLGDALGWRWSFALVVVLSAAAAGALALLVRDAGPPVPMTLDIWRRLLSFRPLRDGLLVTFAQSWSQFTVFTYVTALLLAQAGIGLTVVAALLLANGLAGVAGTGVGGRIADRFPPVPALAVSMVLLAAALATFSVIHGVVLAGLAVVLWGAVGWGFNPIQQRRLVSLEPSAAAATLALHSSFIYLGSALGAVLGALVIAVSGLVWVPVAGAAVVGFGLAALASSAGAERRLTAATVGAEMRAPAATRQLPSGQDATRS